MYSILTTLIDRLDSLSASKANVIKWASPVPSFSDLSKSQVASVGINPSNREFVDQSGTELEGPARRFHTLRSLRISSWSEADARHLDLIIQSCYEYFKHNPYDRWFKRLDYVIAGANVSYYSKTEKACHLDLIPYATDCKWTELTSGQRSWLYSAAQGTLGSLLRDSPIRILILNGKSVVRQFEIIAGVNLAKTEMLSWSLPRRVIDNVKGIAYTGVVTSINGIELGRSVLVLGFNHNLQSSFGVTNEITESIRQWIAEASEGRSK